MNDADKKAFEAHFNNLPIHPSNDREYRLLKETWQAALAHRDTQQQAEVERLVEALRSIEKDNHYWSTRPCETCQEVTQVLGSNYGCVAMRAAAIKARKEANDAE